MQLGGKPLEADFQSGSHGGAQDAELYAGEKGRRQASGLLRSFPEIGPGRPHMSKDLTGCIVSSGVFQAEGDVEVWI